MILTDWDPVVIPIILIAPYFFGYLLYLGLRRLIKRPINRKRAEVKGQ